ncbi:glyceraldehyde 3-phosphate dehydrogenase (phosphorylating) [Nematocida sp. LUAm3]|nr:glyceraldehyde 3-phosphate dehydrogenase (phosphorylating) [Nematocida sp. LUAm3]KAI5175357.1 glyceraldehyde 3-phosphate dehydrogenase (phosphorylating) [Nematocida sp. LUAm2]KAI5177686.1 glyceraldehyde 3-phosphate dehydrogenase (phosphorylating) [Nematocida sp. LUAm1]
MKVGINGAGRIGKLVTRILLSKNIEIGCINDPFVDAKYFAYLLARDSTHGSLKDICVSSEGNTIKLSGSVNLQIAITNHKSPSEAEWKKYGVDYVIEASGVFTTTEKAQGHIQAGAKAVIITAPSSDAPMFVMGVNEKEYKGEQIISNASCTTNCLAPLVKVLEDSFGIEEGLATTVHALTATQRIVDGMSMKQYRDGRGGLQNLIPASTGAAAAIGKVIPSLQGKLTGMAIRVPVADVSIVDLTVRLKNSASAEDVKRKMKEASEGHLKGILEYTEDPVVSTDFIGCTASSVFDATASMFLSDRFIKVIGWYDNEHAYSSRVVDLLEHVARGSH